ncbi:MAG: hypothetical protein KDJ28_08645 [Candidatus Competibacteraceae bacterium]|nr:hypothetical protein [Candidatus Competibacteraceae bacterium]
MFDEEKEGGERDQDNAGQQEKAAHDSGSRSQRGPWRVGAAVALCEQEATSAWQEATPTAAKMSNRPMNLRRKSGIAAEGFSS